MSKAEQKCGSLYSQHLLNQGQLVIDLDKCQTDYIISSAVSLQYDAKAHGRQDVGGSSLNLTAEKHLYLNDLTDRSYCLISNRPQ